jgi:hypothetical protein
VQFPQPTITRELLTGFVQIWYLWVPLLILLIAVGLATRQWFGGRLLLLSLVVLTSFAIYITLRERVIERKKISAWNSLRVPLHQATRIDGLQLAAGTMVRWNTESEGHLLTAELGSGQEVAPGIVLAGEADLKFEDSWRGTLANPSVIRGWNCAAGKIDIHISGQLRWCVLANQRAVPAGVIPAGTAVLLDRPNDPSDVLLHLPKAGMRVLPGNYWIAPDEWFVLYSNGELLALPGPITLRGVAFKKGGVLLRYGEEDITRWYGLADQIPPTLTGPTGSVTGWRGDIDSPLSCVGGHKLEKGTRVTVPTTGDVVATISWDSSGARIKPVLTFLHCDLDRKN